MCIIVAKKKGIKMPSVETLKNCWLANDDGAGFAFSALNNVKIFKGFMTFEDFLLALQAVEKTVDTTETPFILHFRVQTHGGQQKRLTHPFPLSNKDEKLSSLVCDTDCAIAHNGIIHGKAYDNGKDSDTYLYIKKVLARQRISNIRKKNWLESLSRETGSKWAFLTKNGQLYTAGQFVENDGVLYSNTGYKGYKEYSLSHLFQYDNTKEMAEYGFEDDWDWYDSILGPALVNDILALNLSVRMTNKILCLVAQRIESRFFVCGE